MVTDETVWVACNSHRARSALYSVLGERPEDSYGVWPDDGWPRGEYYKVPPHMADPVRKIKGLRVLRGEPKGGKVFKRW